MKPLTVTGSEDGSNLDGVNVVDVNPAHSLVALGLDGEYAVEFWDPRSQTRTSLLRVIPPHSSFATSEFIAGPTPSITALSSHSNGLSIAVGTSSGYTMLYDLRSPSSWACKDQGYGSPITSLAWLEGLRRGEGKGEVLMSGDRKVVKVWEGHNVRHLQITGERIFLSFSIQSTYNLTTHTPSSPISCAHHVPNSGLFMLSHEASDLSTLYIPGLGRAPKWCSFLDNVTEEVEKTSGGDGAVGAGWEDYRFVERNELVR
jgi:ribosome biogenesis protein ENP2